ncbi:flagellar transcriptional regulator FlhC [Tatumella sp. TA1]|uniref:flagellar transcriptional regulator FlhC n=1 Tax=Rosenbergiella collisarenosi TaxID=1544695 RepID=UPI0008F883FD|nr:flagellar transcriptional regulator FlhC [Rosenbergiella collisarenosi]MBT0720758.1 flagellar transcriptional regulator FlhC [Rosenbergiella collisarenosi]QGX91299.1 flagellar transcriptional regulator FlhC [Tatumella sp. TA1]
MKEKSVLREGYDIRVAMDLIRLGARLQLLENETVLSRGRLIRLYKEIKGCPPPKGMLPFSTDWFMTWEHNIHATVFYHAWQFLRKTTDKTDVDCLILAYRLYLEQCPVAEGANEPLLGLTRAWTLIRFAESGMIELSPCRLCQAKFINHAHQPKGSFVCSLCQPPSRAIKKRKPFYLNADKEGEESEGLRYGIL